MIYVMKTRPVPTLSEAMTAVVLQVIAEMDSLAQILMNALWVQTTVVSTLAVWTAQAVLIVCATKDLVEMVLIVPTLMNVS
jgi:hypothetical protein